MPQSKVIDKDSAWRELLKQVSKLSGGMHTRVGVVGEQASKANGQTTNAVVALANEYGTSTIPQRSFIGATFDKLETKLETQFISFAQSFIDRKLLDIKQPFDAIGLMLSTEIKKYVTTGSEVPPPNAQSTIDRKLAKSGGKGTTRTLIDTAQMINAITWIVAKGRKPQ